MTLKQFLYLLFGVGIAFMFFKAPIGTPRYILAGFSLFLGIAFAFIPINERPLEVWLANFIKSIYSPTLFLWEKDAALPLYLLPASRKTGQRAVKQQTTEELHRETRAKLDAYLKSVSAKGQTGLDAEESQALKRIGGVIIQQPAIQPKSSGSLFRKPVISSGRIAQETHSVKRSGEKATVSGIVRYGQEPVPEILVHIYDNQHKPVRLMKTNKAGGFSSAIPLSRGLYTITVEDPKQRYRFKHYSFEVKDQALKPWLIEPESVVN